MTLTSVIPNNYRLNNKEYLYKILLNTPVSNFLNTNPLSYEPFVNLKLAMVSNGGGVENSDVVALQRVELGDSTYRVYWEGLTITNGTPNKTYYFVIYDSVSEEVIMVLNCFKLIALSEINKYARLSYRNSTNIFNYNYEQLPEFRNVVFVDLNEIGELPEYEDNVYPEATTGYIRMQKTQLKNYTTLQSYNFDPRAHNAMKGLSQHDDVEINFRKYQIKEGYEYELNRRNNRQEGTIELYIQDDNEINLKGAQ